jgi:hypothetical protein
MDAIHKILVPTDFSAHAVVSECGRFLTNPGQGKAVNLWDRFQSLQADDPKIRVEHQVIVADRPGATHVLEILEKLGCDLIVMGTHGSSWLKHRLFGSVTEEVVRRARCPVMVVKAPAHKAALPALQASTKAEDGHAGQK